MDDYQQEEAAPKPRKPRVKQVRNELKGPFAAGDMRWQSGELKELTTEQRKDKRIQHALNNGILAEV